MWSSIDIDWGNISVDVSFGINKAKNMKTKKIISIVLYTIKYLFFTILLLQCSAMVDKPWLFICGVVEVLFVAVISGYLSDKNRVAGYILNVVLLLVVGVELVVFRFSGGFVSLIMITNLNSIHAISGKVPMYLPYIILFVVALCIPTPCIKRKKQGKGFKKVILIFACLVTEIAVVVMTDYSPIENSIILVSHMWIRHENYEEIKQNVNGDARDLDTLFYKDTVGDNITSPFKKENPDIVLIFTEGLSQNIVDDERDIMPNVRYYEQNSLWFTNYYNHTAATYRGILGQLYSGHQYNNLDENPLISMQQIMGENGYETTMINTEPNNSDFSKYLESLGFDEVVTDEETEDWITDDKAYSLLENTLLEKRKSEQPQFIVIYTFGTHVTLDNTTHKYGDGSNGLLNRFANDDYYFGEFMSQFAGNDEFDDLAVVFTSDHCTNEDEDFIKTFEPEYRRDDFFCDKVPFFIWYNGVNATKLDAGGRNSLCMAPTVLDYFDIDGANYFLGRSLFTENDGNFLLDKVYSIPDSDYYKYTSIDSVRDLTEQERNESVPLIQKYMSYTIKATDVAQ